MDIQSVALSPDTSVIQTTGKRAPSVSNETTSTPKVEKQTPAKETSQAKSNKPESPQDIQKAAQKLQDSMSSMRGNIQFSVDEASGKTIVKIVDEKTKDVLMQLPSKTALAIAESLDQGNKTNLISDSA